MSKSRTSMKIHWNGQTGGVVGYTVRGNDFWRSLPNSYHDACNEAQQLSRAKLSYVSKFIHNIGGIYKAGYRHFNPSVRQRENFAHQIYQDALSGNLTDGLVINPADVLVARGGLTPTHSIAAAVAPATQTVTISWSDNSGVGDARATDKLLYCAYNATKQESVFSDNAATRADETCSFNYPADWSGDTLYLYAAWASGTSESDSSMLGFYTA